VPFSSIASSRLPRPVVTAFNRLLQIDKLEKLYESARTGGDFSRDLLAELGVDVQVAQSDLDKIPKTGPVIAVANHPFGLLDGAIMADLLTRVRPDLRVLTNHLLGAVPEIARYGIFIDPFDRPESRAANGRGLKQAIAHVKQGGLLLIFPAGEVSHFDFRAGAIRDPEWRSTAARLVRMTGAKVAPILIRGTNSIPFQMLGMVHPRLRTAALPAELLNKRGRAVEVRIGGIIDPAKIQALATDDAAIRYMRLRTDLLARRGPATLSQSAPTESVAAPLAAARPAEDLAREIHRLPAQCLLEQARDLEVYLVEAPQAPLVLEEIGRLREITFRAAGEGTGQPTDLDRFDAHYLHLFVWNREKQEVVGAYRIGDVPRLLARFGRKGLYTESLFRFRPGFVEQLGPALEMGRSFIRPGYQRQFAPLMLLWKGIGVYVTRRPEYTTLIGAVSVSNQYTRASRELIARFFEANALRADQGAVKARRPLRGNFVEKWEMQALCSLLPDVEDLSGPIGDLEPDGKGIPILVKQYVKLGGRLLAFSVDPQFGNTLDGFVMVDLRDTPEETLGRYMGRDGARAFRGWHRTLTPRVA
jgi:putative hemolysin